MYNAFIYKIHYAKISTPSDTEIEQNKIVGPVSTIIKLVTLKYGNLSTYFDRVDESMGGINNSSLKQILITNQTEPIRGIKRNHFPLKWRNGFCRSFEKIPKGLGLALELTTSNRKRNNRYTTLGDKKVYVTINILCLYIPTSITSPEIQKTFKETILKKFCITKWIMGNRSKTSRYSSKISARYRKCE